MIRIGMAGYWHVHAWGYTELLQQRNDVTIAAVYDEDAVRGQEAATKLGVPFFADLGAFVTQDLDAVVVNTRTTAHRDVIVAAAKAGKHIFTEKCLATNMADANAIARAVEEAGVKFCISYPQRCRAMFRAAKAAADAGRLGRITYMRVRIAHDGASRGWLPPHFYAQEDTGGGAMMDLGAHPMYLSAWILGRPKRITSLFNTITGKPVEDNAASLIAFENGALCVAETSFVSQGCPDTLELYGTAGMLVAGGPQGGVTITAKDGEQSGWFRPQLGPDEPAPLAQFVDRLQDGGEMPFGLVDALALTELMEGAYRAAQAGCTQEF